MKKVLSIFLLGIMGFLVETAAKTISSSNEIVWFGLDYTMVKFIGGSDSFSDLEQIQGHYFRSWNECTVVMCSCRR